ncbi:hypothetical protein WA026_014109 [Henosepilachna vigintioctopunctata]|uniref:Uncharacterized protein n=1 Tax=Henosepilachna vigintioctopunctata TaxID=420089 RepID=A0AAW1TKD2_9CUCU
MYERSEGSHGYWVPISSQLKLAQKIIAADAGVVPELPSDLSCVQRGGESLHLIPVDRRCAVLLRQLSCSGRWGPLAEETKRIKGHQLRRVSVLLWKLGTYILAVGVSAGNTCSGCWSSAYYSTTGVVLLSDLSCGQRGGAQRILTTSSVVLQWIVGTELRIAVCSVQLIPPLTSEKEKKYILQILNSWNSKY